MDAFRWTGRGGKSRKDMIMVSFLEYREMSKRHYAAGPKRSWRRNDQLMAIRAAVAESLEARTLLSVSPVEYATIRSTYADFVLPADMAQVNIIEIMADQLSLANLRGAITAAAGTLLPDLVVVRTSDTQNTITYTSFADALGINIPAAQGAISIVGFGSRPLTLDAAQQWRLISVGATNSTTTVNLGGLMLSNGRATDNGGGVSQSYGTLRMTNVTISGNTLSSYGFPTYGGGLYLDSGIMTLTNVTISGNAASSAGPSYGGGLYVASGNSTLTDVTISENTASYSGGGLYLSSGTATLTNVMISGNTASSYGSGGGLYQSSGTSTLTNVTISGNTASYGGGLFLSSGTSTLTNVTISGNAASYGGGLYLYQYSGSLTLKNSIVARNTADAGPDLTPGGTLSGANNLIGDGTGQTSLVNGVGGNIVGTTTSPIDPMLAEGRSLGIGLSPVAGSPAIDAGDDSLIPSGVSMDIYGAARIQGARVNIGAVETVLPWMAGLTYVVNSLDDSIAVGDGKLTLREALAAANMNRVAGDALAGSYSSGDRIEFAAGLTGTILTHGQAYQILGSLTLVGPGAGQLTLDAGGNGGVVDIRGAGYDVSVSGLTVTGGNASCGGGVYSSGVHLVLDHVVISGNTAYYAGGMYLSYGTSTVTNVTISGNTASSSFAYPGYGGGLYLSSGSSTLTNVTISGNTAGGGGGLYQSSGASTLTNVTITGNAAHPSGGYGGGLYMYSGTQALKNTIVARNGARTAPDLYRSGATLSGANNLIGDGTGQTSLVNGVSGNLVGTPASPLYPQFVSMTGTDWTQWDLRLRSDSPAVNSGNNAWISPGITADIAGGPRIVGGTVDMGSSEFNAAPTDAAPGNLAARAFSPDQINLTWSDDYSSEIGFRIERATDSLFTHDLVSATVPANATSFAATALSLNTTYYFRAAAMTAQGDTPFSPAVQATLRLGDATLDGQVDLTDLTVLAGNWQSTGKTFADGDFNGDGNVDLTDLTILAGYWQTSMPAAPSAAPAVTVVVASVVENNAEPLVVAEVNEPLIASSPEAGAAQIYDQSPMSPPVPEITSAADNQAPAIHLSEVLAPPVSLVGSAAPDDTISLPAYVLSPTSTYSDDADDIIHCFLEDDRISPTTNDDPILAAADDKDDPSYRSEIPLNLSHNPFYAGPQAENPGRDLLDEMTQADLLS